AALPTGRYDSARQVDVRALEVAVEDTDEIDDRVDRGHQAAERRVVVHVRLHHIDGRQQDQAFCALAFTRGDAHANAACGELTHDVAAEKSGAADDEDIANDHVEDRIRRL